MMWKSNVNTEWIAKTRMTGGLIQLTMLWGSIFAFPVLGATKENPPTIKAIKVSAAPKIDGKLDEDLWTQAAIVTDLIAYWSEKPSKKATMVRVAYDQATIYVGFVCEEPDPNRLLANERNRDRDLWGDDWVEVQIDTYDDHRHRYIYVTNPRGTRYDAKAGLSGWNTNWDSHWQVACSIEENRWVVEMAIPIADMLFSKSDHAVWGINFHRGDQEFQEASTWSFNKYHPFSPQYFGHCENLDLSNTKVKPLQQAEVYVSGNASKENSGELNTGGDVAIRLGPQWVAAATINPDFGQVEADPDTIELRDTERFLEERRTFFKEGAEMYETPIKAFYSRRITDIDAGAKVTGQNRQSELGITDVVGTITREDQSRQGHYQVGRLVRNMNANSQVGGLWTLSDREDGYNLTAGPDTKIRVHEDATWSTQFLGLKDERGIATNGVSDREAYAFQTQLEGDTKRFLWKAYYSDITRGFQPDLGYIPRRDIRGPGGLIGYEADRDQGPLKRISAGTSGAWFENHENRTAVSDIEQWANFRFRNDWEPWFRWGSLYHAPYQNWYARSGLAYGLADYWRSVNGYYEQGEFEETPYDEWDIEKPIKLSAKLNTKLVASYRIEKPHVGFRKVCLARWITEYWLTDRLRIKLTLEQTNQNRHNYTMMWSWFSGSTLDVYLVLADTQEDHRQDQSIFAKAVYHF